MRLYDLVFSDLCLAEEWRDCWIKETPDSFDVRTLPRAMAEELVALYDEIHETGKASFVYAWQFSEAGEITLRVQRMETLTGNIYVCRRFMLKANTLAELGFPPSLRNLLMSPDRRDGLLVFCGKAGSGKTTAAYTYAKERLDTHGGVLWTIENPPELLLSGRHGKGVCYQMEVGADEAMGVHTPALLRATPNYIFYGEIRDAATLKQAVKLSLSGHLVLMTIHAGDLVACITRMGEFLGTDAGLLAEALRAVLYLELHQLGNVPVDALKGAAPTGSPPRVLGVSPLFVDGLDSELKSLLRDRAYHALGNIIEKKRRQFMNANLLGAGAKLPGSTF